MPKFVYALHGGGKMPDTPGEKQTMSDAWRSWMGSLGEALVDPGNPVGRSRTVTASGVRDDGGANPLAGYMLVNARDLDEAVAMARGCPALQGGGTIEVAEAMEMQM